jgi:hypothetical protein
MFFNSSIKNTYVSHMLKYMSSYMKNLLIVLREIPSNPVCRFFYPILVIKTEHVVTTCLKDI